MTEVDAEGGHFVLRLASNTLAYGAQVEVRELDGSGEVVDSAPVTLRWPRGAC